MLLQAALAVLAPAHILVIYPRVSCEAVAVLAHKPMRSTPTYIALLSVGVELCLSLIGFGHGQSMRGKLASGQYILRVKELAVVTHVEVLHVVLVLRAQLGTPLHCLKVIFVLEMRQAHTISLQVHNSCKLSHYLGTL